MRSTQKDGDDSEEEQDRLLEVGIGSQILHDLGVRDMVLLSNSPQRKVVGLEGYGLQITDYRKFK